MGRIYKHICVIISELCWSYIIVAFYTMFAVFTSITGWVKSRSQHGLWLLTAHFATKRSTGRWLVTRTDNNQRPPCDHFGRKVFGAASATSSLPKWLSTDHRSLFFLPLFLLWSQGAHWLFLVASHSVTEVLDGSIVTVYIYTHGVSALGVQCN